MDFNKGLAAIFANIGRGKNFLKVATLCIQDRADIYGLDKKIFTLLRRSQNGK